MSDSEDYEYEYDESDQEAMGDGGGDEEQSFEYTDDEGEPKENDGEIALENAYYNAKSERGAGDVRERDSHGGRAEEEGCGGGG